MAMTRKEFWIHAYLACLHRHDPAEAVAHATTALHLCDEHWKTPEVEVITRLTADTPVGQVDPNRQGTIKKRHSSSDRQEP